MGDNYLLVSKYLSEHFYLNVNKYLETLLEKNGHFFKNTDLTFEKVRFRRSFHFLKLF